MRLLGYVALFCLALALLRLAVILGLIVLGLWFLWALLSHPAETLGWMILLAATSFASAHPVLAVLLLLAGIAAARLDSGKTGGELEN